MRFLITGITGFAGRHLAERLRADGHEVFGTTRRLNPNADTGGTGPLVVPGDHLLVVSLSDRRGLTDVVGRTRPDGVFHLAALTRVQASFADPEETYRTNLLGSVNLFAAVRDAAPGCRIAWMGSSEAYGRVQPHDLPVTETQLFRPLSPYAVSKAAGDLAAYQWSQAHQLNIVRLRPFSHTGPGQASDFVCSDFARQVILLERGEGPPQIEVGNLDVTRDFSDVRDIVRAYTLAWQHAETAEAYNVCSGIGRTIREILEALLRLTGLDARIVVHSQRQRPVDVPLLVGSAAKLRAATAWTPMISWEQTLRDLLDDWRRRVSART